MLLMPKRDWQWKYNDSYGVLSISLGDEMEFLTPYVKKLLIPDASSELTFDVEHAKFYISFIERLNKTVAISDAEKVQMALNATASHFLLKPQMPKSWFFTVSQHCVYSELGKLFQLESYGGKADFVVVETGTQASLVMLLNESLSLSADRSLNQFDCIKVMHDRLHPSLSQQKVVAA